jgi:hypothetical protein
MARLLIPCDAAWLRNCASQPSKPPGPLPHVSALAAFDTAMDMAKAAAANPARVLVLW